MSVILYNASKIKSFENLKALSLMVGETIEFATELWQDMLRDEELLEEFNYFVSNHTLKGTIACGELTLLDIYFSQMNKYNIYHDMGKNTDYCNKDRMVLHAFKQMVDMRKDPHYMVNFEKREESGMDKQ
ncbi:MAG: hypothetical protein E7258_01315 [Lachnospiraceae bacterium]|nr:hypothetical protein [Lachnospiraceae bacterium]